ncbi:embryo-specific protein ATS3B-like isoform X2 [Vigna unguiculata]|nr:embryo-specific protein ATS3B-like isoform X2 [Vigna unguiculata]
MQKKMMKQVLLFLCFASALTLSFSESKSDSLQNPDTDSFSFGYIQTKTPENCSYLVIISTSCSSPKFTWEKIGIAFGDAHGNEVYKPRLDGPGIFEQCSLDVFQINGACLSDICYLYLYRSGAVDDWKPESVKICYNNTWFPIINIHFSLPDAKWYGHYWCNTSHPPYLANGLPFRNGVFF